MISQEHLPHALFALFYLLVLIGLGVWKARSVKTQEDFSLAGRGLGVFVLSGTLLATWIGTGSIFGNAEETWKVGAAAFLLPIPGVLGILGLYLLSARLRRLEGFTVQDVLEERFGPAARVLGTLALLGAYVVIVSYQFRAGAAVVEVLFPGVGSTGAIVAVALFVVAYTALAGMISVAYTDVANGLLMSLGIALALVLLVAKAGGPEGVIEALPAAQRDVFGHYGAVELLSVLLPTLLLILGDANMVQRFFSARDVRAARRSAAFMLVGVLLLEFAIIALALTGRALAEQGQIAAPDNPAHVILALAFDGLPTALGALLVGTVLAVVVSTADSYLLAPATSLVRDVWSRFLVPGASEQSAVRASRLAVVLLGAVALGLAFASTEFFRVALYAYTLYGVTITPAFLAALLWKGATPAGGVASMAVGLGTALAWKIFQDRLPAALDGTDPVLPAAALSVLTLVVVSLFTAPRNPSGSNADSIES
jgi:SSS family solute:Na+ symporter